MKVRTKLLVCFLVFLAGIIHVEANSPDEKKDTKVAKPNILFISIDDLRPELGSYGKSYIFSPNIDQIAEKGLVFERAYCQAPQCTPSRASVLTGRRPEELGAFLFADNFRDNFPDLFTLPQYFRRHGYLTVNFGKTFSHDPDGPEDPTAWDQFYSTMEGFYGPAGYSYLLDVIAKMPQFRGVNYARDFYPTKFHPLMQRGYAYEAVDTDDESILMDGKVARKAVQFLRDQQPRKPFFMAVGFIKPHVPFVAPKKYWDLYDESRISLADNYYYPTGAPIYAPNDSDEFRKYTYIPSRGKFSPELQRKLKHGYYACISYIDAQVGLLLAELKRSGLEKNTIIVLWGDHGYQLGENGFWGKQSNYELSTRVPLIISVPGMKNRGGRTKAFTELIDIYPTLLELAGLPIAEGMQGISFKPILNRPTRQWKKAAFSVYQGHPMVRTEGKFNHFGFSMRTDRYRFVKWVDGDNHVTAFELYDHSKDPEENTNIANSPMNQLLVRRLEAQLNRGWRGALPK